jgi:hypothetical protein
VLTVHELAKVPPIYDRSAIVGVYAVDGVTYVVIWQAPPETEQTRFGIGDRGELVELDAQGAIKR